MDAENCRLYQVTLGQCRWVSKVRKELEFDLAVLSAYACNPTLLALRRLFELVRYLKGTPTLGLIFDGRHPEIEGYSDADFGVSPDGRSYTGVVIRAAGCPITAFCRKQTIATASTACAEIIALSSLVRKMEELKCVLDSINFSPQLPLPLYCDNTSAVLAGKTLTSRKSRHLGVRVATIRDPVMRLKTMELFQLPSAQNLADMFTKPLGPTDFLKFRGILFEGAPFTPVPLPPQTK